MTQITIPTLLASIVAVPVAAADVPARDWAATLRADARALHDDIAANHPGAVNAADPGFRALNDRALATALRRARQARGYPGYRFALSAYVAGFDDGHLVAVATDAAPAADRRWPGFLTAYAADGSYRVAARADDAPVPTGATLVACDGVPAERLARERLGAFNGRWMLAARRSLLARELFLDAGNPFAMRPVRCTFAWQGRDHLVPLAWRPLSASEADQRLTAIGGRAREPIGQRTLADGTRWVSLSGFKADPAGEDARALVPTIAALAADRAALSRAPAIVLDLRGNNGGSSDWSLQIARILWGEAAVRAADGEATAVDWRVSPATIATMRDLRDRFAAAPDASADNRLWSTRIHAGLSEAAARGDTLWREADQPQVAAAVAPPAPPLGAPIYVVTDWGCGSACLDAVDLWRKLGAIQVGQETSADTLYMDVRHTVLPSGLTRAVVPMKVYRGRARGANQPWLPVHPYPGDLRDTAALAGWIATLPERKVAIGPGAPIG